MTKRIVLLNYSRTSPLVRMSGGTSVPVYHMGCPACFCMLFPHRDFGVPGLSLVSLASPPASQVVVHQQRSSSRRSAWRPSASTWPSIGQTVPATLPPQPVRPGLRPRHPVAFAWLTRAAHEGRESRTTPCVCGLWAVCVRDAPIHLERSSPTTLADTATQRFRRMFSVSAFGRFPIPTQCHHGPTAPKQDADVDSDVYVRPRSGEFSQQQTGSHSARVSHHSVGEPTHTQEAPNHARSGAGTEPAACLRGDRSSVRTRLNSEGEERLPCARCRVNASPGGRVSASSVAARRSRCRYRLLLIRIADLHR